MTARASWKAVERAVAKAVGGFRTPLSGGNSHLTTGDVVHETLYVEVKWRKKHAALQLMHETEERAWKESKVPVVVLHEAGNGTVYFLVSQENVAALASTLEQRRG